MIKLKQYRYHVVTSLGAINICNVTVIGLNNSGQMSPTGHYKTSPICTMF